MDHPETEAVAKKLWNIMAGHEFILGEIESNRFTFKKANEPDFGMVVFLDNKLFEEKYRITATWPHASGWGPFFGDAIEISVSRSKSDEAIRRDIEKRFLAIYIPSLKVQVERKLRYIQDNTNRNATIRDFSKLLNSEVTGQSSDTIRPYRHGVNQFRVNHDGTTVSIETTSLPYDDALKVLELLKNLRPEKS